MPRHGIALAITVALALTVAPMSAGAMADVSTTHHQPGAASPALANPGINPAADSGNQTDDGNQTNSGNQTNNGNQSNATTNRGPADNPPAGASAFGDTTPLDANQTTPDSLAGQIRVDTQYKADTSVELTRDTSNNYSLSITIDADATNVTFYLQKEAVAASQNINNVTMDVDGTTTSFAVTDQSSGKWIVFVVDHFSTREVSFTSPAEVAPIGDFENPPADTDADGKMDDVNGDGQFTISDVQALFVNRAADPITNNQAKFDFNGDGSFTIADIQAFFLDRTG